MAGRVDWWKKFNSKELCEHYSKEFYIWWDPYKFNWPRASMDLIQYCSDYFDVWWDANNTDHKYVSIFSWVHFKHLAKYCTKYFNIWWDADKWNWEFCSWNLVQYCSEYFDIWWDADKFNWDELEPMYEDSSEFLAVGVNPESYISSPVLLVSYYAHKFPEPVLKKLLLHPNVIARRFAKDVLERRGNDKR